MAVQVFTIFSNSGYCTISDIPVVAAFCSQYAWSIKTSSNDFSAAFAQRGSVTNFNPNMPQS
jgi:hypothetical protein